MGYDRDIVETTPQAHRSPARSAADRIYDRLVRDVFGRIVPGLLLLFALGASVVSFGDLSLAVERATVWMWVLAFGAGWVTSFALMEIGRRLSLVVLSPETITDEQYWAAEERFRAAASRRQRAEYERLVTIREATATSSVALFVSLLAIGADFVIDVNLHESPWSEIRNGAVAFVVLVALGVALQLIHRDYARRVWKYLTYAAGLPPV